MSKSGTVPPKRQRTLVFQGAVALGAYEAGVFKGLYERILEKDPASEQGMFDIVAGTSSGAINASIVVSHVKQLKTWKGAADKLVNYWKHLSSPTPGIAKAYGYAFGEAA